ARAPLNMSRYPSTLCSKDIRERLSSPLAAWVRPPAAGSATACLADFRPYLQRGDVGTGSRAANPDRLVTIGGGANRDDVVPRGNCRQWMLRRHAPEPDAGMHAPALI